MAYRALTPLEKIDPTRAWQPWEPAADDPWDTRRAAHLYRRAAFGATLSELRKAVADGPGEAIRHLLEGEPASESRLRLLERMGELIASRNNPEELRSWWVYNLLHTPHPFLEKMTLFWHNHFATSVAKVGRTLMMFQQNLLLRKHALGRFEPFLQEMSKDPAMLVWLDSNSNVKGTPNENYARELMELFSLGVGNYAEKDIREAARSFTGWHTNDYRFEFNPLVHDDGTKTVLGNTGKWNGDDIVRICIKQPVCARFILRKLYAYFISENEVPPDSLVEPLAEQWRKNDYDIAKLMETILRSRHFFSEYAYRQRIKSPAEFVLGTARAFSHGSLQQAPLVRRMDAMGQQLFAPPNVKGWVHGQAWLNTTTVLARQNFAQSVAFGGLQVNNFEEQLGSAGSVGEARVIAVANNQIGDPAKEVRFPSADPVALLHREHAEKPEAVVELLLELLLGGDAEPAIRKRLVGYLAESGAADERSSRQREVVHAILCLPAYQLA